MESIEQRAKSKVVCAADYIAGANEERILITEQFGSWLANMVCEGVLETSNLPHAIARFKADFGVVPTEKCYKSGVKYN